MILYIVIGFLSLLLLLAVGYIIWTTLYSPCSVCKDCPECPDCPQECPVCEECPKCPECNCPVDQSEVKKLKMTIYLLSSNMLPPLSNMFGNYKALGMTDQQIYNMVNEYTKLYSGVGSAAIKNYAAGIMNETDKDSKVHWQLAKGKVL